MSHTNYNGTDLIRTGLLLILYVPQGTINLVSDAIIKCIFLSWILPPVAN